MLSAPVQGPQIDPGFPDHSDGPAEEGEDIKALLHLPQDGDGSEGLDVILSDDPIDEEDEEEEEEKEVHSVEFVYPKKFKGRKRNSKRWGRARPNRKKRQFH